MHRLPSAMADIERLLSAVANIERLLEDVLRRLTKLESHVFLSEAEEQSDRFTVAIKMEKVGEEPLNGHGVVVNENHQYYLKSCFHVFLNAWARFGIGQFTTTITWAYRPQGRRMLVCLEDFLIPTCIAEDLYFVDIAMYKIDFATHRHRWETEVVQVETGALEGRKVLAKSTTRMEGCANELDRPVKLNTDMAYNEYVSMATAKPGTSGSPSFDNSKKYIGMVRGRGNADASSSGLDERLAQASHFGVSPAGLHFAVVDPTQLEYLQSLITLKRNADKDLRTVIIDFLERNPEFSLEGFQDFLRGLFIEEKDSVDFGPNNEQEVYMTLVTGREEDDLPVTNTENGPDGDSDELQIMICVMLPIMLYVMLPT